MSASKKAPKPVLAPAPWSVDSWRGKPVVQMPTYPDPGKVKEVEAQLQSFPPLVFANEVRDLTKKLAKVAAGESFLFQGGDCAESFKEHSPDNIVAFFRVFLQSALVMTFQGGLPIVKVGRIAGQFAKPRSSDIEERNGTKLPSYRGDIVNGFEFDAGSRIPDPVRMLQAYRQSAATLNFLRALLQGGYASLSHMQEWALDFMKGKPIEAAYEQLAAEIERTLGIMKALGINEANTESLRTADFYTSHEALLLGYEQALARKDGLMKSGEYFSTSAHMLWIGDRTRQADHAHVEFCRGVFNPVGLKCGPTLQVDDLLRLAQTLNPMNTPGKLTLICRFGADKVDKHLAPMIRAVEREGLSVVWSCDPMHGNTETAKSGYKTRRFQRVRDEVQSFFDIHRTEGTHAGGIHIEMTGQNVTECTGGVAAVSDAALAERYETLVDPRLNAEQSLEIAFLVADMLKKEQAARNRSGKA